MKTKKRAEIARVISELWFDDTWSYESGGAYPYVTKDNGDVSYTKEAQDCFNGIYIQVEDILNYYTKTKGTDT